jgi:hypothetical protein
LNCDRDREMPDCYRPVKKREQVVFLNKIIAVLKPVDAHDGDAGDAQATELGTDPMQVGTSLSRLLENVSVGPQCAGTTASALSGANADAGGRPRSEFTKPGFGATRDRCVFDSIGWNSSIYQMRVGAQ